MIANLAGVPSIFSSKSISQPRLIRKSRPHYANGLIILPFENGINILPAVRPGLAFPPGASTPRGVLFIFYDIIVRLNY